MNISLRNLVGVADDPSYRNLCETSLPVLLNDISHKFVFFSFRRICPSITERGTGKPSDTRSSRLPFNFERASSETSSSTH